MCYCGELVTLYDVVHYLVLLCVPWYKDFSDIKMSFLKMYTLSCMVMHSEVCMFGNCNICPHSHERLLDTLFSGGLVLVRMTRGKQTTKSFVLGKQTTKNLSWVLSTVYIRV